MDSMFAGKSDEAVKKATGKTWNEWIKLLNSKNASNLTHKEIVLLLKNEGFIKSGWWAQSVTVGYEQAIGRRVVHQTGVDEFSASVSKTLEGTMDSVLKSWEKLVKGKKEFNNVKIEGEQRISSTDKWRYWKMNLSDGSKINVGIYEKKDGKALLGLSHDKLHDEKSVDEWKNFWKELVSKID